MNPLVVNTGGAMCCSDVGRNAGLDTGYSFTHLLAQDLTTILEQELIMREVLYGASRRCTLDGRSCLGLGGR